MAAVAPKAALITAFETLGSNAPTFNNPLTFGGRLRSIVSVTDIAAADSTADICHVTPLYSSWRIDGIPVKCDALTSGSDYNLGLYTTAGVDVDENVYGDAIDLSSAITSLPIDALDEIRDIALGAQAVWADAGASADTRKWYYLSWTLITPGSAAGQIVTRVRYVDGAS
jgi:hypothetical protein